MLDAFYRLPPLVASILITIGLLVLSVLVGLLFGDSRLDALSLAMALTFGIDFFVLMRNRQGGPRFGSTGSRSLVLLLLVALLTAAIYLWYPLKPHLIPLVLVVIVASSPAFVAIGRSQTIPFERKPR